MEGIKKEGEKGLRDKIPYRRESRKCLFKMGRQREALRMLEEAANGFQDCLDESMIWMKIRQEWFEWAELKMEFIYFVPVLSLDLR